MSRYSLSGWWKAFTQRPRPDKPRRRSDGPGVPRRRPPLRLETLEGRALPSTFTVVNLADAGPGSLRQAITDANNHPGPDLITFDPQLQGTIALTSGQLGITDNLVVAGPGADRLAVSGSDVSRVFDVAPGTEVTLLGLTVSHGSATQGAGIQNAGVLTLVDMVISDNLALSTTRNAQGGGVFDAHGAALVASDTTFQNNTALTPVPVAGSLPGARGGGLYNEGDAILDDFQLLEEHGFNHSFCERRNLG